MDGTLTWKQHIASVLGGLVIASCVIAILVWTMPREADLPPKLTDEQISSEVIRCNSLGLVLDISYNRRHYQCRPPTTIVVRP